MEETRRQLCERTPPRARNPIQRPLHAAGCLGSARRPSVPEFAGTTARAAGVRARTNVEAHNQCDRRGLQPLLLPPFGHQALPLWPHLSSLARRSGCKSGAVQR